MKDKGVFLKFAKSDMTSEVGTESRLIEKISEMNKYCFLVFKDKASLLRDFSILIKMILDQHSASVICYDLENSLTITELGDISNYTRETMLNHSSDYSGKNICTCIYFREREYGVFTNGILDKDYVSILESYKSVMEKHDKLIKLHQLNEAFDHFQVKNRHNLCYFIDQSGDNKLVFDVTSGKVQEYIKEQQLRNLLWRYIDENVEGSAEFEFATNQYEDEESVDIKVNNGQTSAIIEVKFSFTNNHYLGRTYYTFESRIIKGLDQLDKYCLNTSQNKINIRYAYLYMFHTQERDEGLLRNICTKLYNERFDNFTSEFRERYSGSILDDVTRWKKS